MFRRVAAAITIVRFPKPTFSAFAMGRNHAKYCPLGNNFVDWKVATARQWSRISLHHEDDVCARCLNSVLALPLRTQRKISTSFLPQGCLSTFHVQVMQQHPVAIVHERVDSLVRSSSSDTTRLTDNEARPYQAQTPNFTKPKQSAPITRDHQPSYIDADEPLLISGWGSAKSTTSQTADLSLKDRRALDLTYKARKALRNRVGQREDYCQRTRTRNPQVCDPHERVEERRGVWMEVTPDDIRAPFGERKVYDKVYRGRGCFEDSGVGRWRRRSEE